MPESFGDANDLEILPVDQGSDNQPETFESQGQHQVIGGDLGQHPPHFFDLCHPGDHKNDGKQDENDQQGGKEFRLGFFPGFRFRSRLIFRSLGCLAQMLSDGDFSCWIMG